VTTYYIASSLEIMTAINALIATLKPQSRATDHHIAIQ